MTAGPSAAPPRVAVWLVARRLRGAEGDALLGDLLEEFHDVRVARDGPATARRWFWRETLLALATLRPRRTPHSADCRGDTAMRSFLADLRHGARLLRRAPAFTALCVLTFALGIGATAAIYSVVSPTLLRSLPYPDPDRIITVWERDAEGQQSNVGYATFADLARDARTLQHAAALGSWTPTITEGAAPERVAGQRVTWGFFRVLGIRPALGRDFTADDDVPGRQQAVVLGHGLWRRRFGGDSAVVGRAISIGGEPHTVVGVLPASFDNVVAPDAQIWRALGYRDQQWACRTCRHLRMIARVRPGVTTRDAASELDRLSASLVRAFPQDYAAAGTHVVGLQGQVTRAYRPMLLALLGATGLVLLIAAANVAGLQLARAARRDGEFAVRAALGAGGARLTRQLVAEGVVLAALGGTAGVLAAAVALPSLRAALPEGLPRLAAVRLDLSAVALAAGTTVLLGVVAGLAPAWQGVRLVMFGALRQSTRVAGPRRHVARSGLVVAEVALALMLLVGAGLLSRTLLRLTSVDVGFEPAKLLTMEVQATGPRYADDAAVYASHERLLDAARAVPGVVAAGIVSQLPLGGNTDAYGVNAQDKPLANPELAPYADRYVVSTDLMRAMGIRVRRGRAFDAADSRDSAQRVVIVSEALAAVVWPGEDPLGKRVRLGGPDAPWRTVVGVAGNVRHSGLDASVTQQVYVPERQWAWADNQVALVVRTAGDPAAVAQAVRRAVQGVDPGQPVTRLATMEQVVATSTAERRLARLLFGAFAAVALVLAAAGIYGVLASRVAERAREFGVRSALGAGPRDIVRLVARHGAALAVPGLALGIVGALAFGRLLRGLLFAVQPTDAVTLGAVAALLAAVACVACAVPAARALRVDPSTTLRAE